MFPWAGDRRPPALSVRALDYRPAPSSFRTDEGQAAFRPRRVSPRASAAFGAKGNSADHNACAERCFERGAKAILVVGDDKVYLLDNQDLAKQHVGHEVRVTGQLDGDSIKVEAIEATKAE